MPNEFEKIVQQKMDELKVVPSGPVWQKVEMQIRKKKDRRRLILWLPLLALLLGGGLWIGIDHYSKNLGYHKPNDEAQKQNSITKTTDKTATTVTTEKDIDQTPLETKNQNNNTTATNAIEKKSNKNSTSKNQVQPSSDIETSSRSTRKVIIPSRSFERTKDPKGKWVVKETTALSNHDQSVSVNNESEEEVVHHPVGKIELVSSFQIVPTSSLSNALTFDSVQMEPVIVISVKQDTTLKEKPEIKKLAKSNWKLNIVASSGVSGLNRLNLFNGDKSLASAAPSGGGSSVFYYGPSPVKKGFAFSIGALQKKQLSSRTSFSSGLQYGYYSNTVNVGTVVNQSLRVMDYTVAQYYSNAYSNTSAATHPYRNQYHFVSVPFFIDWQMLKKLPLNFHTGLSLQYLVKTNALRFDYNTQSYFYNKKAFNRIDLVSEFGFNYSALLKQKPLFFGPEFQYGISRLEKGNSANHLFSYGLKAQWQLSKK